MAIPKLYERVALKSYPELRYIDGHPEGYGGGSPFSMGLSGLCTRTVAAFVKHFEVTGEWRERDVEEFSKGRVPDNSMMLNIAIRAAMDRMTILQSFRSVLRLSSISLARLTSGTNQLGHEREADADNISRTVSKTDSSIPHSQIADSKNNTPSLSRPANSFFTISQAHRHRPSMLSRRFLLTPPQLQEA